MTPEYYANLRKRKYDFVKNRLGQNFVHSSNGITLFKMTSIKDYKNDYYLTLALNDKDYAAIDASTAIKNLYPHKIKMFNLKEDEKNDR